MAHTIFLVEDDLRLRVELAALLERYGYRCLTTTDFSQVDRQILDSGAGLVLLDLGLPQFDGYHVCRAVRQHSDVPIVVVTSRDGPRDELMSMNLGCDDFITKPYDPDILLARIARILHRAYPATPSPTLCHEGLCLDLGQSVVRFQGQEVELTKNECRILQTLMKRPGAIVGRDELMQALWQSDEFVDDNTLTVNVNRLRKRLSDIGAGSMLATRRGLGYQL